MEVIDVINRIYKDDEKRKWEDIYDAVLSFDVSIDTLSNTLNMDQNYLLNQLSLQKDVIRYKPNITEQSIAEANFIHFFARLFNACAKKDEELQRKILREISDQDIQEFKKRHVEGYKLTDDDIVIILKYQLKYFLSTEKLCNKEYLGLFRNNYIDRVYKLSDEYHELKDKFDTLSRFYELKFRQNHIYNQSKGSR